VAQLSRRALLIGVEKYDDCRFPRLPSCRADTLQLKQVLEHPAISTFDSVAVMCDPTAVDMRQAIVAFLDECDHETLALLYVSGHGTRLRNSSGEFFFVARDTDFDRVAETGVSAGFVNEQLEACRAPQKVTIIDACESGGFAVGLRTQDAKQNQSAPLQSRGVYVLSSSGMGEASYSGAPSASGAPTPSVFTHEIIEALRTGKADNDGDGKVSVEDLFHYVSGRVRGHELRSVQVPVYSSVGVNSKIIIASVIAGAAVRLPTPAAEPARGRAVGLPADTGRVPPPPMARAEQWTRLLDYYGRCVKAESVDAPLLRLPDAGDKFVYLDGRERILSGGHSGDDHVKLSEETAAWLERATESGDELWAGYPAVLLYGPEGNPSRDAQFAPLLVRRVEVVQTDSASRLEPFGPAQPHLGLAHRCLGAEQAQHLAATYFATWHAGAYTQMVKDIRGLLDAEYGLPIVEELRPEYLAETLDDRTPTAGARNVAVLFRAHRQTAVANLLQDLDDIEGMRERIEGTALGALLLRPGAAVATGPPPNPVTPWPANEAQRAVITSAMTATLTVATGPPGTGKSQLVADAVATAVARGQSVLVASTNNTAVDEVWRRCQRLVPGMLVRTGTRHAAVNYADNETEELNALLRREPPATNLATADAAFLRATHQWERVRTELRAVADLERSLLELAERRERLAAQLSSTTGDLADRLGGGDRLGLGDRLGRWERRAQRCASARLLARWRRRRLLDMLGHPGEPSATTCQVFADFAAAERQWSSLRRRAERLPADAVFADKLYQAQQEIHESSRVLIDTAVRSAASGGRRRIEHLLEVKKLWEDRKVRTDWPAVRQSLPAVRGWAVSSLSVRRFPADAALFDLVIVDEASQCSVPHVLPLLFRARRALVIGIRCSCRTLPRSPRTGKPRCVDRPG
jgi:hypothetical protein